MLPSPNHFYSDSASSYSQIVSVFVWHFTLRLIDKYTIIFSQFKDLHHVIVPWFSTKCFTWNILSPLFQLLLAKYIFIYPKYDVGVKKYFDLFDARLLRALHSRTPQKNSNPLIFPWKIATYSCFWPWYHNIFIHFHISLYVECFTWNIPLFIKNAEINVSRETFSRFR